MVGAADKVWSYGHEDHPAPVWPVPLQHVHTEGCCWSVRPHVQGFIISLTVIVNYTPSQHDLMKNSFDDNIY